MRFQCPHCQQIVDIDDAECGQPVGCGNCGNITVVPDSRFAPGAVINDFIVKGILGRGGMGMVYLAHQMTLDRPVALKILMDEFANNSAFIVDFVKEARAAARLNHPNIVQSYAVGEEDGVYYFAMEYVEGKTLKQEMESNPNLPVERVLNIILQIAEALDFAWKQQQLVHRDIKPDNIMLTLRGVAKLADLGLARVANELLHDDDDEVMGTPQYICPEQLLGQPMDVRGDIYSLGATFFHAVTGEFPFEGVTAAEIARKHLQEPLRRPSDVRPAVPDTVSYIIEKMMKKRLEERYEDASELVHDLGRVLRNEAPLGYDAASRGRPTAGKVNPLAKTSNGQAKATGIRPATKTKFKTGTGLTPAAAPAAPPSPPPPAPPQDAAPSTSAADAVTDEEAAATDAPELAPEVAGKGSKRLKFSAKKKGGPPSTMSLPAAEAGGPRTASTAGSRAGNPPSTVVRRRGKLKLLIVGAALLFVAVVAVGIYVLTEANKYNYKTTAAVKAHYLAQVSAEEREGYQRLVELLEKKVTGEQEMAHLSNLVTQLHNFTQKQPKSLFCLAPTAIDSLPALQLPGLAAKFRQEQLIALARPMAGELTNALEERQEQLLRKLRQQAHLDEQEQVVNTNRKLNKAKGALDESMVRFREFLATRKRAVEADLRRYQASHKRRLELFEKEKESVREQVLMLSFDFQLHEAKSKLEELARARGEYPPSVEAQIEVVLNEREEDKALEDLVTTLSQNKDIGVTAGELRQMLKAELPPLGLAELYKQLQQVKQDEAGFPPQREAFFERQKTLLGWAIQFHELVANTQVHFKARRVPPQAGLPFKVTPGQVVEISLILSNDIMLDLREYSTAAQAQVTKETQKMPLRQLDLKLFMDLARAKWGEVNQTEFELFKTTYLLYTGRLTRLQDAIGALTDGRAAWLTEELKPAEPLWRTYKMEETYQRIKAMVEAKEMDNAKRYFEGAKRALGDSPEFKKREQELLGLLGN